MRASSATTVVNVLPSPHNISSPVTGAINSIDSPAHKIVSGPSEKDAGAKALSTCMESMSLPHAFVAVSVYMPADATSNSDDEDPSCQTSVVPGEGRYCNNKVLPAQMIVSTPS